MEKDNDIQSQSVKEDIIKRIEKRNEDRELQRSANLNERSKNAQENQAILDKLNSWSTKLLNDIETSNPSNQDANGKAIDKKYSIDSFDKIIPSLSEEIKKFDCYFNE